MSLNKKSLRISEQQLWIPIALPIVQGNKDYRDHKELLQNIDRLLGSSGIESAVQEQEIIKATALADKPLSKKDRKRVQLWTSHALRCNLVRLLSHESFRNLAVHLAESPLLQNFCQLSEFDRVRIPSKSTLQAYSEAFDEKQIRDIVSALNLATQTGVLGFSKKPDLSIVLLDSTCIETNIHFPVDWVLLRDAVRTMIKSMLCIRRHGLKHRIKDPSKFLSKMNTLCMTMSLGTRTADAKKRRKEILRLMKKLVRCVEKHAMRYRELLDKCWTETDLTRKQAEMILRRLDNILDQLPAAVEQAHERIIGERQVSNEKKILSFYESHTQVYHRGKSGTDTEFGLQLLVGESAHGILVDWDLVEGSPKNDTQHVVPCLKRLRASGIRVAGIVGDKGFHSEKNSKHLKKNKIANALCPRNVTQLKEKQKDLQFVKFQKRRAQTEGRIGILKNRFIGQSLPVKGLERQKKHVALCVLSQNLWVLARLLAQEEKEKSIALKRAA
jgi:hypothetical protein